MLIGSQKTSPTVSLDLPTLHISQPGGTQWVGFCVQLLSPSMFQTHPHCGRYQDLSPVMAAHCPLAWGDLVLFTVFSRWDLGCVGFIALVKKLL